MKLITKTPKEMLRFLSDTPSREEIIKTADWIRTVHTGLLRESNNTVEA